ncbi:MAG: NADH-quinone oxidoreductase subunit K [Desulfurococcales archaeon]|nr:NADH-quinone oxidoreductase subunit K [Desulfurococcales archaeon]
MIEYLILYLYTSLFIIFAIAVYGVVVKPNIIKKIIALSIAGDTANTLIIFLGYRLIEYPKPPVLPTLNPSRGEINSFVKEAVDPIPQALVITAIVINLAVVAFLVFLSIQLYKLYGTLDHRKILVRRGVGSEA